MRFHPGAINDMQASSDGMFLATTSNDNALKVYDVVNFGALPSLRMACCLLTSSDRYDQHALP